MPSGVDYSTSVPVCQGLPRNFSLGQPETPEFGAQLATANALSSKRFSTNVSEQKKSRIASQSEKDSRSTQEEVIMAGNIRKDAPYAEFGERLTRLRIESGMSRAELAEKVGLSPRAVANYENGERIPFGDSCADIAKVLHISVDELLGVDDPESEMLIAELTASSESAMSARAIARANKSIREAQEVLGAGGLSPEDRRGYILTMQRLLLDASVEATDKFTTFANRGPDWEEKKAQRHAEADKVRRMIEKKADELDE